MLLAGLDIGGTKIGICLGRADGTVLAHRQRPAQADRPAAETLADCLRDLDSLRTAAGDPSLAAIGAACPGPVSVAEGCFLDPPNMPGWHGFPLRAFLSEKLACPIGMMNDADATMLAEHRWGAARDVRHAVYLTMSTGMGAGLLLDGQVYQGSRSLAGEIGHLRLSEDGPVGFGRRGSAEGYLSGPGIVQVAEAERLRCRQIGETTALADTAPLTTAGVFAAAREHDPAAVRVVQQVGDRLGQLLAILTDVLNPELFVLGTIGSAHFDLLADRARAVLARDAIPHAAAAVRLAPSGLADRGHQSALAVALQAAT